MKRRILLAAAAASLAALASLSAVADEPAPLIPFVAVTGRPTAADVARKVAHLKSVGYGQFMVYARSGLQYDYMGEDWLKTVEAFCREAEANGLKVWLYDEYNWPSGTCKGRVPNENEAWRDSETAVYREADGTYRWVDVLSPKGWVNLLEPEAGARFVELTHEVYGRLLERWFANGTIRGFFTDEPGHPTSIRFDGQPLVHFRRWKSLAADYRSATGRDFKSDVEAWLTARAEDPDGAACAKAAAVWEDYAALAGRQLRTAYFDRIRAWCDSRGVLFTGHMMAESDLKYSCFCNGNPLHLLKGESLPGMDEVWTRPTAKDAEWVTFAVAQHAARRNGRGGAVELFACGPNDMAPARMRQMIWLCALHNIDHYMLSMDAMDMRGLVEKHGYLAPFQEGQSWTGQMRPLLDEARRAARFGRKTAFARAASVRYPQKAAARAAHAGGKVPRLNDLLRAFETRQVGFDLYEEGERADEPFDFAALADGTFVETKSGTSFETADAAADWVHARVRPRLLVRESSGEIAGDLVVRNYDDGSSVVLNLSETGDRTLVAEQGGKRTTFRLAARGVLALEPGEDVPPVREERVVREADGMRFALTLGQANVWRVNFDTNKVGRLVVGAPLRGVRFALREFTLAYAVTEDGRPVDFEAPSEGEKVFRHDAVPYTFELDGKPLVPARPCAALRPLFNPLYRETEPVDLAPGVHTLRIVTGEADRNFFLPALFAAGDFAVVDGVLSPRPAAVGTGTLAAAGIATHPGTVTYTATVTPPRDAARLRLETGGVFTTVSLDGRPLGVRAWSPFEWDVPAAVRGRPCELSVTLHLPLVNMMGDVDAPGADWDLRMWMKPRSVFDAGLLAPPAWVLE